MTKLESLRLNGTNITDGGLVQLEDMEHLRLLDLTGTGVTDKCVDFLAGLKSLKFLTVRKTKVTAAGARQLKAKLPKTNIFH